MKKERSLKEEQEMRLLNVVLYGLAAVIWLANAVVHLLVDFASLPDILLTVFCALIWCFSFVVHLMRWLDIRKKSKEETENPPRSL